MNAVEERKDYYRSADVRARIREFTGATTVDDEPCEFLAASDENSSPHPVFFLAALVIAIAALIQSLVNAASHLTHRHP